jgi:hypothetical protein
VPKKSRVSLELTVSAKEHLAKLSAKTGLTQAAIISALLEWFSKQPPEICIFALNQLPPKIRTEVAKILLKQHLSNPAQTSVSRNTSR